MATYKLTAFEKTGELAFEETITASTDEEAKDKGIQVLEEKQWSEKTHRLSSSKGALVLFHT